MSLSRVSLAFLSTIFFLSAFMGLSAAEAEAQSKIPQGSYKKTCNNLRVLEGYLSGYCLNDKGDSVPAKIYLDSCLGDIRNENGELKCKHNPAYKPPSGSYKSSCRDITVEGKKLKAQCQKKNGNWKRTSINYKKCDRDIWNDNGELSCSKKNGGKLPKGSYKDTCRDAYTEGNRLYADCKKKNGGWNKSSINYKNCNKNISNDNGKLICGKANGGKIPKGSYRDTCRDAYTEGSRLYANCQKRGGGWNNSSINYKNCNKDISNDNGKLVCGKSGNSKLPPGSYKNSCRNIYKDGNVLEAECRNDNGKWKHTSIKFKKCDKGLWNDNGKLRCN